MDRETEMYHAAIKILSNRAGQYDDELEHAVDNVELLKKKERMLNQSKWERNRRGNKNMRDSNGNKLSIQIPRDSFEDDPDLIAEVGKHGYADTNRIGRARGYGRGKIASGGHSEVTKRTLNAFDEALNKISTSSIKTKYKTGESPETIAEEIRKILISQGINVLSENSYSSPNSYFRQAIEEKVAKAIR